MSKSSNNPLFLNYPIPKEAPEVPYQNDSGANPVLRGNPLALAAWIVSSSSFVSGTLWKNAQFHKLRDIRELDSYAPRHDPTVIPLAAAVSQKGGSAPLASTLSPLPRHNTHLPYTSADYVEAYKSGSLTPSDVIDGLLAFLADPVNSKHAVAFIQLRPEQARKAARESTLRYRDGKPLGPLDGVPVAIKDEVELAGCQRTMGSQIDFTSKSGETSWCVKKWEEVGVVAIGKANMHELGLDISNNNPCTGTPLNPHNPDHYTGGSSGGSAHAISSGLIPIALGADGGGSIRIPSSLCGIYGLKPSHGRISALPTRDIGSSVGVIGPMASHTVDLRLAYRIMAKPDLAHHSSHQFPDPGLSSFIPRQPNSPSDQKYIGICPPWLSRADPPVRDLITAFITYYTSTLGYIPIEISLPLLPQAQKAHALSILSELHSSLTAPQIAQLSAPSRLILTAAGRHAAALDFVAAQKLRNLLMRHLAFLWEQYPGMVVVSPTMAGVGMPIKSAADVLLAADGGRGVTDSDATLRGMEYVFLANLVGCPAVSAPMGYVPDTAGDGKGSGKGGGDLPVGVMGLGEWGSEEALLDWVEEGNGFLDGKGGLRKPGGWEGAWVDVLGLARKRKLEQEEGR